MSTDIHFKLQALYIFIYKTIYKPEEKIINISMLLQAAYIQ